jgi:ribosome biogenesis protein MAK21
MPRDKSFKKGSQAKAAAPAPQPAQAGKSYQGKPSAKPGQSKISDELRQAVKDLGGDDEDLELIAGVDEDEADSDAGSVKAPSMKMSEVSRVEATGDMGET